MEQEVQEVETETTTTEEVETNSEEVVKTFTQEETKYLTKNLSVKELKQHSILI